MSVTVGKTRAEFITPSTTTSTGTRISPIRISVTAGRWRETIGLAVLRLADAEILPFDFSDFTDTVQRYVDEIQKLAQTQRAGIIEKNREIEEGVFSASDDPKHKTVPPPAEAVPPFLDLAPLQNGLAALQTASARYDKAFEHARENGGSIPARISLQALNADLIAVERSLTLPDGLPARAWFQNQIYAPGLYTGYGVKTLPGVRESIEQKQWKLAQEQIARVGGVLENAGERIQSATAELDRGAQ